MKKRNRILSMLLTVTMITAQVPATPVLASADEPGYVIETAEDAEDDEMGSYEEYISLPDEDDHYAENRVVSLAADEADARNIAAAYGAKLASFDYGIAVIDLEGSGYTVTSAIEAYNASEGMLPVIEPDYIADSCLETEEAEDDAQQAAGSGLNNDTGWHEIYSSLTDPDPALNPSAYYYQWYHDMINTYDAWAMTKGNNTVTTAVISDGSKLIHEDLKGMTGAHLSNSLLTYSHGTPLSGIVGAHINNGKGGAGIAPDAAVMGVNANNEKGEITSAGLASALAYVAEINIEKKEKDGKTTYTLSLKQDVSGPKAQIAVLDGKLHTTSTLLEKVINMAYEKRNMTIIAPAGDDDSEMPSYPAAYEKVIAVAAVDSNAEKTARSSYGDWVDLAAPGYEIYTPSGEGTDRENLSKYSFVTGSSAAAAMIAGVCSLYMSAEGNTAPAKMKEILMANLTEVKPAAPSTQKSNTYVYPGKGCINAANVIGGKDIAPRISIYELDGNTQPYGIAEPTKTADIRNVTAGSHLQLTAMQERTVDKKKKYVELNGVNVTQIYTLNGKDPRVIKDEASGEIKLGENTFICGSGVISMNEIIGNTPFGIKKATIKAACVDYKGNMGKITTMKLTTVFLGTGGISINLVNVPTTIVAGKKIKLKAQVLYINEKGELSLHENQKVTWNLKPANSQLDGSTGLLSTKKGTDETVTITCTPDVDSNSAKTFTINVSSRILPVKKIQLDNTSVELDYSDPSGMLNGSKDVRKEAVISISSAVDKEGAELFKTGQVKFEWKSSKTSVATIEVLNGGSSVRVIPQGKGTAQISCTALDGSNKTVKCKVKVKQLVTDISIKGLNGIANGGKATYKATCTAYKTVKGVTKKVAPNKKKVTWSLLDPATGASTVNGVNIDPKKGKLTVTYGAIQADKEIYVVATADDNGHYVQKKKIVLLAKNKTTSVKIDFVTDWSADYYLPVRNKNTNSVKSITMHSEQATKGSTIPTSVELQGITTNGAIPIWTSSDSSIVKLVSTSINRASFVALKTGSATITCDAADGSNKKATVKVTVIVPSSGIRLIDSKLEVYDNPEGISYSYLAKGGSTKLKPSLGSAYGDPTIKDVKWELEIVGYKTTVSGCKSIPITNTYAQKEMKDKLFTMQKGIVSVNKAYDSRSKTYAAYLPEGAEGFAAIVYATTKDGAYNATGRLLVPVNATKTLKIYNDDAEKGKTAWTIKLSNGYNSQLKINSDMVMPSFTARSSDSSVVNACVENNVLTLRAKKEGKAEITVTANDGSGKSAKLTVTVEK